MVQKKIKDKILNFLNFNGKKHSFEIIFQKSIKEIQKKNKKNHLSMIKYMIIKNIYLITLKKKKKKKHSKKILYNPIIIKKNNRINNSIKLLTKKKNKNLYIYLKRLFNFKSNSSFDYLKKNKIDTYSETLKKKKFFNYKWF